MLPKGDPRETPRARAKASREKEKEKGKAKTAAAAAASALKGAIVHPQCLLIKRRPRSANFGLKVLANSACLRASAGIAKMCQGPRPLLR